MEKELEVVIDTESEAMRRIAEEAESALDTVFNHKNNKKKHNKNKEKHVEKVELTEEEEKELLEKAAKEIELRCSEIEAEQERVNKELINKRAEIEKIIKNHKEHVNFHELVNISCWYLIDMGSIKNGRYLDAAKVGMVKFAEQTDAKGFIQEYSLARAGFILVKGWDLIHKHLKFFKRCKDALPKSSK